MIEVRNNGVPLLEQAPKAAITQSVLALAATLSGDESAAANQEGAGKKSGLVGLFNRWTSRGGK
jgi:pilus assembly protein CpaE